MAGLKINLLLFIFLLIHESSGNFFDENFFYGKLKSKYPKLKKVEGDDFNLFIGAIMDVESNEGIKDCKFGEELKYKRICYSKVNYHDKIEYSRMFLLYNYFTNSKYNLWITNVLRSPQLESVVIGTYNTKIFNHTLPYNVHFPKILDPRAFIYDNYLITSTNELFEINICQFCEKEIEVSKVNVSLHLSASIVDDLKKCFDKESEACVQDIDTKKLIKVPKGRELLVYHRYNMSVYTVCCTQKSGALETCSDIIPDNIDYASVNESRCINLVYDHSTKTDYYMPDVLFNITDAKGSEYFFPLFDQNDKLLKDRVPEMNNKRKKEKIKREEVIGEKTGFKQQFSFILIVVLTFVWL